MLLEWKHHSAFLLLLVHVKGMLHEGAANGKAQDGVGSSKPRLDAVVASLQDRRVQTERIACRIEIEK